MTDPTNVRRLTNEGFSILGDIPFDHIPDGPLKDHLIAKTAELHMSLAAIGCLLDEMDTP